MPAGTCRCSWRSPRRPAQGTAGRAAVGLPHLGMLAAESAGLELACGMRIDEPGPRWGRVLAITLEAVPVVLVGALGPVSGQVARRLRAVLRRSGSVLIAAGGWEGAEVRLRVVAASWDGVGWWCVPSGETPSSPWSGP